MYPKQFKIMDWAGNEINTPRYFASFEDAWSYISETYPEQDQEEYYVVEMNKEAL